MSPARRHALWLAEQHEDLVLPADLEEFDFLESLTHERVRRDLIAHLSPSEASLLAAARTRNAA